MPGIIWNRRCKRCHGNLAVEQDEYGSYLCCIQCGAVETEKPEPVLAYVPDETPKKHKASVTLH